MIKKKKKTNSQIRKIDDESQYIHPITADARPYRV